MVIGALYPILAEQSSVRMRKHLSPRNSRSFRYIGELREIVGGTLCMTALGMFKKNSRFSWIGIADISVTKV